MTGARWTAVLLQKSCYEWYGTAAPGMNDWSPLDRCVATEVHQAGELIECVNIVTPLAANAEQTEENWV